MSYKAIKQIVHDNYEDNLFSTLTIYENNDCRDTGLVDSTGTRLYHFPDKIQLGFDTNGCKSKK